MDRRTFLLGAAALALAGCASSPSPAPPSGAGPQFSAADRQRITAFYAGERRGPARDKPAQRVQSGDLLDSGQRPARLPDALDKALPYLPEPHARLVLGADVILVNRQTHRISDVIPQVAY